VLSGDTEANGTLSEHAHRAANRHHRRLPACGIEIRDLDRGQLVVRDLRRRNKGRHAEVRGEAERGAGSRDKAAM
jgi:hypothetical protein